MIIDVELDYRSADLQAGFQIHIVCDPLRGLTQIVRLSCGLMRSRAVEVGRWTRSQPQGYQVTRTKSRIVHMTHLLTGLPVTNKVLTDHPSWLTCGALKGLARVQVYALSRYHLTYQGWRGYCTGLVGELILRCLVKKWRRARDKPMSLPPLVVN